MLAFIKMHGLGNDFVILDGRAQTLALDVAAIQAIADRRTGVGCDQLIVLEPGDDDAEDKNAAAFMRIYNADGSEVGACGNATRCVAALLMKERSQPAVTIKTRAGLLHARAAAGAPGLVTVDMGPPRLAWDEIPLAVACDTLHLPVAEGPLADPVAVNVGNPHAVFFVPAVATVPLEAIGSRLEHHPLFPERSNVEVVEVVEGAAKGGAENGKAILRVRVWERGAGITRACGTGACAAMIAAHRRGLIGREAEVVLDGGSLSISWGTDGRVLMTGGTTLAFTGTLCQDDFGS